jgi:hypothetical protein
MAKKSLTAQFDEIQAQLEAVGMTVQREGKHSVKASIVLHKTANGYGDWIGSLMIARQLDRENKAVTDARVTINHVHQWSKGESPCDVFAALLAKHFGHTTIGAVFGL